MYSRTTTDMREPDHYGKAFLHVRSSEIVQLCGKILPVSHVENTMEVVDFVPFWNAQSLQLHTRTWSPKSNHRTLCIDLVEKRLTRFYSCRHGMKEALV